MNSEQTTLQQCVSDIQVHGDVDPSKGKQAQVHFLIHPDLKEIAEEILEKHDVSLSAYLRKCCENLVRDYRDAGYRA